MSYALTLKIKQLLHSGYKRILDVLRASITLTSFCTKVVTRNINMKFVIFATLLALTLAAPRPDDADRNRNAKILRDDRVHPEGGAYSFDIETDNGIKISEGGQPEGEAQAIHSAGEISFPLDNGETFVLKYVANENGYQPESPFLPVAPAFPHPIPQFVLDQIAFAEQQRREEERNRKA